MSVTITTSVHFVSKVQSCVTLNVKSKNLEKKNSERYIRTKA